MKRIIRLTESDLARIVKRVISESDGPQNLNGVIGMPIYLFSDENATKKLGVAIPTSVKSNQGRDKDIVMNVNMDNKKLTLRYSCLYNYFFLEGGNDMKIVYGSDTWWNKFCPAK